MAGNVEGIAMIKSVPPQKVYDVRARIVSVERVLAPMIDDWPPLKDVPLTADNRTTPEEDK